MFLLIESKFGNSWLLFEFIGKIRKKKKQGREYNNSREKSVESWGGKGQWSRSRGRGNGGRDRCSSLLLVGAGIGALEEWTGVVAYY